MKIHQPREPKLHLRSIDTVTSPEVEENPYAELEALLTPEMRDRLERVIGIENYELISGMRDAMILNQAIQRPIQVDLVRSRSTGIISHPHTYSSSELNYQSLENMSSSLQLYPQERDQLDISDDIFDQWLKLLAEEEPKGTGAERFYTVTQMCTHLLHLRPDKFKELQELLRQKGWAREIWQEKKIKVGADAMSVAKLRVFEPDLVLTAEEKKGYVQAFKRVSKSALSTPTFHGWAALAMLLAPSIEVDAQGNIILGKVPKKLAGGHGLPLRSEM